VANPSNESNKVSADAGVLSNANTSGLSGLGGAISFGATPIAIDDLPDAIANQASALTASASASPSLIGAGAVKELDVQLNPADLGALSVKMRLANGNLAVVIEVSKSDTMKLIESKRDEISDRLATADHSVASIVVKASGNDKSYGENGNATGSGTASQGDAQSSTANSSQGRARSSRDDRGGATARQTGLADDQLSGSGNLSGLFV
jgi:flagellar hook-length control protein FliK